MATEDDEDVVRVPIEDELDLHTFRPKEILDVVDSYLEEAVAAGFQEVRIVHGKGTGFQRERVQTFLAQHPLVESFRDAPAHRGHWGATFVRLRRPPQ
ncbi:MAG: Smr/MutS family protein [Candidatus Eisenbacteria bacterium]